MGSAFEEHLTRRTVAAQQFHAADANNILHMAARARSRVISEVQAGQLVYDFRRGKKKAEQGYKGPAKVIAVEKGQSGAPMVAWLSHAGTLIMAAPEHLRMATSLETRTYDILQEASLLNQKDLTGSRYVDLGAIPTAAEERTATHMQVDEPPPMDVSESSPQQPGASSSSQRPDPRTRAREEPDGERPPDRSTPEDSSDSSSDFFLDLIIGRGT